MGLTTKEAAHYKDVSRSTVYRWLSIGKLVNPITKEQLDNITMQSDGISIEDAAKLMGVQPGTVNSWVSYGKLSRPITKEQLADMKEKRRGVKLSEANRELVQANDLSILTEHQRDIVQLHYVEDKTLETIADELGISRAAVKSAEDRALTKLLREKIK